MAELRKNWRRWAGGRVTSFYSSPAHIKIGEQPPTFSAPINDIYGTHVVFGDDAESEEEKEKQK